MSQNFDVISVMIGCFIFCKTTGKNLKKIKDERFEVAQTHKDFKMRLDCQNYEARTPRRVEVSGILPLNIG